MIETLLFKDVLFDACQNQDTTIIWKLIDLTYNSLGNSEEPTLKVGQPTHLKNSYGKHYDEIQISALIKLTGFQPSLE